MNTVISALEIAPEDYDKILQMIRTSAGLDPVRWPLEYPNAKIHVKLANTDLFVIRREKLAA